MIGGQTFYIVALSTISKRTLVWHSVDDSVMLGHQATMIKILDHIANAVTHNAGHQHKCLHNNKPPHFPQQKIPVFWRGNFLKEVVMFFFLIEYRGYPTVRSPSCYKDQRNGCCKTMFHGLSTFACVNHTKLLLCQWQCPLLFNSQLKTFGGTYFLNLSFDYSIRYFSTQSHSFSPSSFTKGMGLPRGPSYKRWIKVFNKDSRSTNICLMVIISWE